MQPGDHVVSVNGQGVQYASDVASGRQRAAASGHRRVTLSCAGVRATAVLSLRNAAASQFRGRTEGQLMKVRACRGAYIL